ncbi:glycerophosphodiester phosphodiesterase family protein [Caldibacillus lycopersici]|uniref:Glycerophosphodiester phosphodiesterase family protein n=1 Tax=Perspicuibacillus lycopersici TaxID=1325689 RepID=A0AAE3IWN1_9BACI|nr:glycerophosphodiester phosphodiesterase family protein [Perspicuibacillus lycopersici]MCU9614764.1 glycerophosphodiester phosphodiesterase family protein [Perspicuibacillus lycopersici]
MSKHPTSTVEDVEEVYTWKLPVPTAIAHRGAPYFAPEHSIPSYEQAKAIGADYIEIDLQMTKDGVLIAMHDKSLDRTTDGNGEIHSLNLEEVKQFHATMSTTGTMDNLQSDVEIPTLEEIFQHFGHSVNYYIETKSPYDYPGMEKELLKLLSKYDLLEKTDENGVPKVIVQSFSQESLKLVHKQEPSIPLILLIDQDFSNISDEQLIEWKKFVIGVGANYQKLTEAQIDNLHGHDLIVHAFTINDSETMKKYIDYGVDGIFTDHINLLMNLIEELEGK